MKKAVYLLLTTLLSMQVFAQQKEVQRFSLKEAVDYAKKYNLTLNNARLDQDYAHQQINEIRAIGLPKIDASGRFTYTPQIPYVGIKNPGFFGPEPTIKFPQGIDYSTALTISASQLLFDGSFLMGLKAAKEFSMLSKYGVKKAEYDVENDIIKAYCMALITEETMILTDANIATLEKTRNDLKAAKEVGLVESTDYERINLSYSNLLILKKQLSDARQLSYYSLKLQMGMNVKDSVILSNDLKSLYENASAEPEIAQTIDYNKRPEYQMLTQQKRMNVLDKKRYQYGYAPTIAAFAQHQQNAFGVDLSGAFAPFYPGTFVGLNVTLPIFDGLNKQAKIQQAKINITKLDRQTIQFENAIEMEVLSAKMTYSRTKEQLVTLKENSDLANTIYKRINLKYQNGMSSSLDVISAEKDLKEAQKNYLNGVYDLLVARANLKKALGQ
ncbi:MAG: TolC family protein [Bacteroidota bacterium]